MPQHAQLHRRAHESHGRGPGHLHELPQRRTRDWQGKQPFRDHRLLRHLPQHDGMATGGRLRPHRCRPRQLWHLPQRSTRHRTGRRPHTVCPGGRGSFGHLRHLPQGRLHGLDTGQVPRQCQRDHAVLDLPRHCETEQRNSHRADGVRDLPQVEHILERRQGRPRQLQHLHRLHRLPQRQRCPGKSATHVPFGATNCITCHATNAWKPSKWDHTQLPVTGQCASCHTGAFPPADGKSPEHTPYHLVAAAASANCDTCHKAGSKAWTPAKLHANVNVTTQCSTCHASAQAEHGHPRRTDGVRDLPQVEYILERRQGRPRQLQRRHRLRGLPQRQLGDGQGLDPHPGGGHELRQLPRHHRLEAQQVGSQAVAGRSPVRELPHRRVPARRRQVGQSHPVSTRGRIGLCQLRHLPQGGLRSVDAGQGARQRDDVHAVLDLPRQHQAEHGHPRRADGVRDLPQVHLRLGRGPRSTTARSTPPPTARAATTAARRRARPRPTSRWGPRTASAATPPPAGSPASGITSSCRSQPSVRAATPARSRPPAASRPVTPRINSWPHRPLPIATPATRRATQRGRRPRCTPT